MSNDPLVEGIARGGQAAFTGASALAAPHFLSPAAAALGVAVWTAAGLAVAAAIFARQDLAD